MNKAVSFAVCDDDELVCETICNKVNKLLSECGIAVSVDKYVSPVALYRNIESGKTSYDALFLDIDMPKISGIELAKAIRKFPRTPDIIFVSNREDMVFEGFSVRPFGFVRKNNFTRDLSDTLRSYINTRIKKEAFIGVETNNNATVRRLKVSDIVYIESFRYKQVIHMANGEDVECRMSMGEFKKKLEEYDIVSVYKSYLVNFKYVQRIERQGILVKHPVRGEETLNVSRDKLQEIKALYLNYLRRMGDVLFDGEEREGELADA